MFNLEQSIAEWRNQMLASGIKSPVPLEELESHLREEIERQVKTGMDVQQAFEMTVSQIGQGAQLKDEFSKAAGPFGFLGNDGFTRVNRILGAVWLVLFSQAFIRGCLTVISYPPFLRSTTGIFFLGLLPLALFGFGLLGSILLIAGTKSGRNIVRILAVIFLFCCILVTFRSFSIVVSIFGLFYLATVWFLFSKSFAKPTASVN